MAYMSQEHKKRIAAKLKEVMPMGWKYSLGVRHHSTIVCTIRQAPFDLIRAFKPSQCFNPETATHVDVNPYHYASHLADACVAEVFERIFEALNLDNYDHSDVQSDYFDRGHYVDLNIGTWDRPFVHTGLPAEVTALLSAA